MKQKVKYCPHCGKATIQEKEWDAHPYSKGDMVILGICTAGLIPALDALYEGKWHRWRCTNCNRITSN